MKIIETVAGVRFGLLTAIKEVSPGKWHCRCDCGAKALVAEANLRAGRVSSCGCALRQATQRDRLLAMLKAGKVTTADLCAAFPSGHAQLLAQLRAAGHKISMRPVKRGRRGLSSYWEYELSL